MFILSSLLVAGFLHNQEPTSTAVINQYVLRYPRNASITSSAVTSSVFGTVRPSALAVLRPIANLEFDWEHEQARIILLHRSGLESASPHKVADRNDAVSRTIWRSHSASRTYRAVQGARHRIARANRQKSGSATGLVNYDGAGSSAADKLSGIWFISRHALGNEDGTAEAHVGAKNARIETGNIVGLQCRSSP
jgi:hypothetical protein